VTVISIQSQVVHGQSETARRSSRCKPAASRSRRSQRRFKQSSPISLMRGGVLDAELVRDLLIGVEERGLVGACKVLISGYLARRRLPLSYSISSAGQSAKPELLYLAIRHGEPSGFYVNADIRALFSKACSLRYHYAKPV